MAGFPEPTKTVAFALAAVVIGWLVLAVSVNRDSGQPAPVPAEPTRNAEPAAQPAIEPTAEPPTPRPEVTQIASSAYVPLAGARTVDELTPWSEGAAVVTILGDGESLVRGSERRPATEEDVARFRAGGKPLEVGQMIGPHGWAVTLFPGHIEWLSGETEDGTVVGQGGFIEPNIREVMEGLPPFEPGRIYLFFLHRTETGLVPQAIQFEIVDGRLRPWSFAGAPLSRAWEGLTLAEVVPEIDRAYGSVNASGWGEAR